MLTPASGIAILGFGDDCRRIAAALAPRGCALRVFDPRVDDTAAGRLLRAQIESLGVDVSSDAGSAVRAARLVILDGALADAHAAESPVDGQVLLDLRTPAGGPGSVAEAAPDDTDTNRLCGWFDGHALQVAGTRAHALAAALSAIGLRSEASDLVHRAKAPSHHAPASACTSDTAPVIRRGELP